MSHNKIEQHAKLFDRIFDRVRMHHGDEAHRISPEPRWVETGDTVDFLQNAKIVVADKLVARHTKLTLLSHESNWFVAWSGTGMLDGVTDLQTSSGTRLKDVTESNPGIFVLCAANGHLGDVTTNEDESLQILERVGSVEGPVPCEDVSSCFHGKVWQAIDPALCNELARDHDNALRAIAAVVILLSEDLARKFDLSSALQLRFLQNLSAPKLLRETAGQHLLALTAYSNEHRFLELYKCLERQFRTITIDNWLSTHRPACIQTSHSASEIADSINQGLGWKPKESGSLQLLLNRAPNHLCEDMARALGLTIDAEFKTEHLTKILYKTRNEVAHYRPEASGGSVDWDSLIAKLLELVATVGSH